MCFCVVTDFVGEKLPPQVLLSWKSVPDHHWHSWATASLGDCQCFWEENNWQGLLIFMFIEPPMHGSCRLPLTGLWQSK